MRALKRFPIIGRAGTLLVLGGLTLAPHAARAGAEGRKNTALALGAAAAYELLNHQTTNGLVLAAGTAYAAKQYEDARRSESQNRAAHDYRHDGRVTDHDYETASGPDRGVPPVRASQARKRHLHRGH